MNLGRFALEGVVWDGVRMPPGEVSIGYVPLDSRDRLGWNGKLSEGRFQYQATGGAKDFETAARSVLPLIDAELETRFRKLKIASKTPNQSLQPTGASARG